MFILYIFAIIQLTSCHYYLNISVDDAKIMQKTFKKNMKNKTADVLQIT